MAILESKIETTVLVISVQKIATFVPIFLYRSTISEMFFYIMLKRIRSSSIL